MLSAAKMFTLAKQESIQLTFHLREVTGSIRYFHENKAIVSLILPFFQQSTVIYKLICKASEKHVNLTEMDWYQGIPQ